MKKVTKMSANMKIRRFVSMALALCMTVCVAMPAFAAWTAELSQNARAAVVDDLKGTVKATQNKNEFPAFKGLALLRENKLGTGRESWSRLELDEGRFAIVEENTDIQIAALADGLTKGGKTTRVYMSGGKVWFDVSKGVSKGESFEVKTPTCALSVRGTVFSVAADGEKETEVTVYDGKVDVRGEQDDGAPLLDRHGNEVFMEVSSGKVKISSRIGMIFNVRQGSIDLEDLAPFLKEGGSGPGGVYSALRGHMRLNSSFMRQIERMAGSLRSGVAIPGVPGIPGLPAPVPRFPW